MSRYTITWASWIGLVSWSLYWVNSAAAQVDQQRAEAYFRDATTLCQRDGGRLWGISLCGPMVFADARTHTLATNQPRPADEWPRVLGLTNAPIEWGGSRWVAYMWDFMTALPTPRARREFLLHELFHRIQPELGLMTLSGRDGLLGLNISQLIGLIIRQYQAGIKNVNFIQAVCPTLSSELVLARQS